MSTQRPRRKAAVRTRERIRAFYAPPSKKRVRNHPCDILPILREIKRLLTELEESIHLSMLIKIGIMRNVFDIILLHPCLYAQHYHFRNVVLSKISYVREQLRCEYFLQDPPIEVYNLHEVMVKIETMIHEVSRT